MKHPRTFQLIAILALLIVPTVANADEIALWASSDPNLIVNRGSGTLTTNALELRASTVGFNNVQVSWAWQRMAAGFDNILLQYSIDGTNFLDLSPLDPPTSFGLVIVSFTEASGAWNNPNFSFRWLVNGATSAFGSVRFVNVVVEGGSTVQMAEPATMLLLGTGLAGVAAGVRRRRRARQDH